MNHVKCLIKKKVYRKRKAGRYNQTYATCTKCGNQTESYGSGDVSTKRCFVLMSMSCPRAEKNFYVAEPGNGKERSDYISEGGFNKFESSDIKATEGDVLFESFFEASSFAKSNPGSVVKRIENGKGFIVSTKRP
jgi:hypothetical protein|tara:strand:+ start:30333 stop:30737 length:405 start_codon:yes stop_codon:yes gene_type:complete